MGLVDISIINYILIFAWGVLMGNFTTTLFHRLPRGIMLHGFDKKNTRPPFCSVCEHILKFYEYLPILSWVSTRGSCNYCGAKITLTYFYLEILGGIFSVLCVFLYGGDVENYLLHFLFFMLAALSLFLEQESGVVRKEITIALTVLGALMRTLNEQSIIPWLVSLSLAAIISLYILKRNISGKIEQNLVHIILPASVWLLMPWLAAFGAGVILFWPPKRNIYGKNLVLLVFLVMLQAS
jgi:prepilin signal peptidase PulO-like enzyme (type II secretory pathway)